MKTAIVLGTFDGLHRGHLAVLAEALPYHSVAVTFSLPPKAVITGDYQMLMMPEDRKNRLKKLGIKQVEMQDFESVRSISAADYLENLYKKYNPSRIVCGFNYRFGKDAQGDTSVLADFCREKKIELCVVPPQCDGKTVISSTLIREYIKNGEMERASTMLYGGFSFTETVQHGDARGRTIGFPTANQAYPELLVKPKFGVYISRVTVDGKQYDAITNIGVRPTYKTDNITSETYIKDLGGDIYGKKVKTELLRFVRAEQKFNSLSELKSTIENDVKLLD